MKYDELSTFIVDNANDIIYMADPDTYELYYLNNTIKKMLGLLRETDWLKKPCYKMLQNREKPCEFCTNHLLTTDNFYFWEYFNPKFGKNFMIKDKLVYIEGKKLRLEIGVDTTEKELVNQKLRQKLKEEETLISCIQTLNQNVDMKKAIEELLEIIGKYYGAERTYIFEINKEQQNLSNTYEWCKENIKSQIEIFKNIPLETAKQWIKILETKEELYIVSSGNAKELNLINYKVIDKKEEINIKAMAVPLKVENKITGFLGVDNPSINIEGIKLMQSVAFFVMNDINKRKMMEELRIQSYTDSLTQLGNRHQYMQVLKAYEKNSPFSMGIIYIDINGLKLANDTYGHQYGDYLINHTAKVLKQLFKENIYRVGGDEFVVFCPNITKVEFKEKIQELRNLSKQDEELRISLGSSWNEGMIDILQQITHTDNLMYIDKQKYYSTKLEIVGNYHISLSKELLREIEEGHFCVYLQPKIELKTGKIESAEALVRRIGKDNKIELPVKFIPYYEAEGIIRHIDFFVLDKVCSILAEWKKKGWKDIKIAVNLSRVTLLEYNITEKLLEVCKKHGIEPKRITIEVTESTGIMEEKELRELIELLEKAGFSISLDDFGSKYSNLSVLTLMNFSEIKIDKSLIDHLENNKKSRIVIEHIIKMCQDLNLTLSVAEGIETSKQKELLETFECIIGQGYYFDKPMPIDKFTAKYINDERKE